MNMGDFQNGLWIDKLSLMIRRRRDTNILGFIFLALCIVVLCVMLLMAEFETNAQDRLAWKNRAYKFALFAAIGLTSYWIIIWIMAEWKTNSEIQKIINNRYIILDSFTNWVQNVFSLKQVGSRLSESLRKVSEKTGEGLRSGIRDTIKSAAKSAVNSAVQSAIKAVTSRVMA